MASWKMVFCVLVLMAMVSGCRTPEGELYAAQRSCETREAGGCE